MTTLVKPSERCIGIAGAIGWLKYAEALDKLPKDQISALSKALWHVQCALAQANGRLK